MATVGVVVVRLALEIWVLRIGVAYGNKITPFSIEIIWRCTSGSVLFDDTVPVHNCIILDAVVVGVVNEVTYQRPIWVTQICGVYHSSEHNQRVVSWIGERVQL